MINVTVIAILLMQIVLAKPKLDRNGNPKWDREGFKNFVKEHNGKGHGWEASDENGLLDSDDDDVISRLAGTTIDENDPLLANWEREKGPQKKHGKRLLQSVFPTAFDLRAKYPACASLRTIRNQGGCGSCWAVAAMNSLSDNYCMKYSTSTLTMQKSFSYEDLLECCPLTLCKSVNGCSGGSPIAAFTHANTTGISTGEDFGNQRLCKPYFLNVSIPVYVLPVPPTCQLACKNTTLYPTPYLKDLTKISSSGYIYKFLPDFDMIAAMKAKLMSGFSLVAYMDVYSDFMTYKSGVYYNTTNIYYGGHAVRLIGWGTDAMGVNYWLCANQWGTAWGEAGYFRIKAGSNVCRIEFLLMWGAF